ncbi:MAG: bifunctional hydroxymethylpyrimidine kinase/phosphomethylpyrimidine kinase [bacterium]
MNKNNTLPIALTIAGSDPSGGAGIQADLKTFTSLGVYGMSVITAVTSQNTQKVNSVYPLPAKIVREQLEAVLSDIKPDVIKIGMLANNEIITVVTDIIKKYKLKNVILDPVMAAKSGTRLLVGAVHEPPNKRAIHELPLQKLISQTFLITPNAIEAEILTGIKVRARHAVPLLESITKAAEKLIKMGAENVLIKGGHLRGDVCKDFLFTGFPTKAFGNDEKNTRLKCVTLSRRRIPTKNTHGTGCTYSSAIACFLVGATLCGRPKKKGSHIGLPLQIAIQNARDYLHLAIKNSLHLGKGCGPVNHLILIQKAYGCQSPPTTVAAGFSLRKQRNLKVAATSKTTQPKGCGCQTETLLSMREEMKKAVKKTK